MYICRVGEGVKKKGFDCRRLNLSNLCVRSCSTSSSSIRAPLTRAVPYDNFQSSSFVVDADGKN